MNNIDSKELEEYTGSALTAIKRGVEGARDFYIKEPVIFELVVVNTRESGGGLKIMVATAEGKLKSEEMNRITLKVHPKIKHQI